MTVRWVARVRINRFTGVKSVKTRVPKTEWQQRAEKAFLEERAKVPEGLAMGLTTDDVHHLSPAMRKCLSLQAGSGEDVSRFRKQELMRKFQRRAFDCNSPAVRIATLTEKILRLRAHVIKNPKHSVPKRVLSIVLSRRQKTMKSLYRHDWLLYKWVCEELGIRCIRFAVPDFKDPQMMRNPLAVDGDRAKFQMRQKIYHGRFRPRVVKDQETGQLLRYTRHPMEPVPANHGKAVKTPQQVSRVWPHGVKQERVEGKQIVYNPTAAGKGYRPAKFVP